MRPPPAIPGPRRFIIAAHLALILFSCTYFVAEASEYAYGFYLMLLGLKGKAPGLHLVAQKGVHFALFFSLGIWLYQSMQADRRSRVFWTVGFCLAAGIGAELFQLLFPGRHAALADVLLNAASGALAAAVASWGHEAPLPQAVASD